MKITIIQQDILWADPQGNCSRLDALLDGAPEADLYVLPEMFATGFVTEPEGLGLGAGLALEWMRMQASKRSAALAGSLAVHEDGKYRNRLYFVRPDGSAEFYDKHHLFRAEARSFEPGQRRVVVEYGGVRFLLLTCYDLRFPAWDRNHSDYDAIIIGASWPEARRTAWDVLLRARAIENQCYVLAANRVGPDPSNVYSGGSVVLGPEGEVLSSAPDFSEECISAEIDIEHLKALRKSFPVLEDADKTV